MPSPWREEPILKPTADGSLTIFDPLSQSHFHSLHGAVGESLHVYIHGSSLPDRMNALSANSGSLNILEIGLGTGLNLLLTAAWVAEARSKTNCEPLVNYLAFEPRPLPADVLKPYYQRIDFPDPQPNPLSIQAVIEAIAFQHTSLELPGIATDLRFKAWMCGQNDWPLNHFDIIYFDPFGPGTAPDMWTIERLHELVLGLKPGGCLTSFSVSGTTRRILAQLPVRVERPPGFGRKREMLRVVRV
jgi:tRNA U34 5-methylaminomethyl-2-thiouridine-forming methyltransferase MnmC